MASEMFWKNQVDVSITIFSNIYHILAVDEFVAIAFVYSTVEEQRAKRTNDHGTLAEEFVRLFDG